VFLLLQYLYKPVRVCGGGNDGHVLRETTSRSLCGLVCPSRTSVCLINCSTYNKVVGVCVGGDSGVEDMCGT
jgi:hypothetical protein